MPRTVKTAVDKRKKAESAESAPSSSKGSNDVNVKAKTNKRRLDVSPVHIDSFRYGNIDGGAVLAVGQGDTGQLGLGEDVMERSKPGLVSTVPNAVDVCCGGMHSLVLDRNGKVFSFGCNDEGALGRHTEDDDECYTPGPVDIDCKIVRISAGDSHSVALSESGQVFYWGTFRDSSGSFGLTSNGIEKLPTKLDTGIQFVSIASGSDHIALLSADGRIFTLGCGEQGQLGRIGERSAQAGRSTRRGLDQLQTPTEVVVNSRLTGGKKRVKFTSVWAGSYSTYAATDDGQIFVCGLNNYGQLGISQTAGARSKRRKIDSGGDESGMPDRPNAVYFAIPSDELNKTSVGQIDQIAPGQHHTVVKTVKSDVLAIGRSDYGRLGLGPECTDSCNLRRISTLCDMSSSCAVVNIACGSVVSFAANKSGIAFAWGMASNGQLACGSDEEDVWTPTPMKGAQLADRAVVAISGGGQHTLLLVKPASSK